MRNIPYLIGSWKTFVHHEWQYRCVVKYPLSMFIHTIWNELRWTVQGFVRVKSVKLHWRKQKIVIKKIL